MSELRVALLIISAGFLAGLTWWEWRRPRHSRAGEAARRAPREAETPPAPALPATESTLLLPEIRAHGPLGRHELPVVELRPDAPAAAPPAPAPAELPPPLPESAAAESPAAPELQELTEAAPAPPAEPDAGGVQAAAAAELAAAAPTQAEELPRLPAAPSPLVDWPPDTERRIVSLRLVATSREPFVGRSLRQALAAEGFVLGRFAIFHKPDEEYRAVLSAASLTRPGTFDADTMDSQHYGGLSLFAVLPGPRPPAQAFEELISTARNLNERLQGALQDERGSPLTTARIALLRERVNSGAPA